jgi:hypothetical protein
MNEAREERAKEDVIIVTPKKARKRNCKEKNNKKIILDRILTVDQKNHFGIENLSLT